MYVLNFPLDHGTQDRSSDGVDDLREFLSQFIDAKCQQWQVFNDLLLATQRVLVLIYHLVEQYHVYMVAEFEVWLVHPCGGIHAWLNNIPISGYRNI